jgi:GTPase
MALVDDVHIVVKAGDGGNGAKTFMSSPGNPKIYSDGGNGGNGGNIYFQASHNISDLSEFRYKKELKAEDGGRGSRNDMTGRSGEDLIVLVPPGTTVTVEDSGKTFEIIELDRPIIVAKGGRGGMGNKSYTPDIKHYSSLSTDGAPGETFPVHLVLHMIADIGFIGLPNAGKSSLLNALTNAQSKIGDYPFTTLEPNLGALGNTILADIPGLIAGASEGKGLGIQFLKHIEKTKVLLHCIDATTDNVVEVYETVRKEFEQYGNALLEKEEIILLTKKDLVDIDVIKRHSKDLKKIGKKILVVSVYDTKSLEGLTKLITSFS